MKRTEYYVSYEVAKLLKEKGFDEPCNSFYEYKKKLYIHDMDTYFPNGMKNSDHDKEGNKGVSAPTLQMACKWLREKGVYMSIDTVISSNGNIYFNIDTYSEESGWNHPVNFYDSYEEAIEAAIKYTLENLI